MNIHKKLVLLLLVFNLFLSATYSQEDKITNEKRLKKEAEEAFARGDYVKAAPLYSQLVSLYPKNFDYNYKFGICLLNTDPEPELAIPYLKYASNDPNIPKLIDLYLGRAYQLSYKFDNAIRHYELFKKNSRGEDISKYEVDRRIEMCRNGKRIMSNVRDIYVIQRRVINEKWFFRSYEIPDTLGKILIKSPDFYTDFDKKRQQENENSTMFIAPDKSYIIFASYGDDGRNGKDLYIVKRIAGGWGAPQNLGPVINSPYDEDYPFVVENQRGKTLYFASKGHNGMGGYDLFRSTFNEETQTWSPPENLEFAINTPFDDLLIVPDKKEEYAYFSSKRDNIQGMVTLYKIRIDIRRSTVQNLTVNENDEIKAQQDLELIKKKAKLEVNATEEMIEQERAQQIAADFRNAEIANKEISNIYVETSKVYSSERNLKRKSDTWPYFVIDDKYKIQDIIYESRAEAARLEGESEDAKYKANQAINIGGDRSAKALKKQKEIEAKEKLLTNPDYKKEWNKIRQEIEDLKREKEDYETEKEVAYQTGRQLWELSIVKKREADALREYADELEKSAVSKSTDEAIAILEKYIERLKKASEEDENKKKILANPITSARYTMILDEIQARKATAESIRNEALKAKSEAEAYRKQANETNDATKKSLLLRKAEENEDKYLTLLESANKEEKEVENLKNKANDILAGKISVDDIAINENKLTNENRSISNVQGENTQKNTDQSLKMSSNTASVNINTSEDKLTEKNNNTENLSLPESKTKSDVFTTENKDVKKSNEPFSTTLSLSNTTQVKSRYENNYNVKSVNPKELTLDEVKKVAEKNDAIAESRVKELKTENNISQYIINKKIEKAKQLINEANRVDNEITSTTDENKKQNLKEKSKELKLQAKQIMAEVTIANAIQEIYNSEVSDLKNDLLKSKEIKTEIENNVQKNNKSKATEKLQQQINIYSDNPSMTSNNTAYRNKIIEIANEKALKAMKLEEEAAKYEKEVTTLNTKIDKLRKEAENTDNEAKSEKLNAEADKLETEVENKTIAIENLREQSKRLLAEAEVMKNQMLIDKVFSEINTLTYKSEEITSNIPTVNNKQQRINELSKEINDLTIKANNLREQSDNIVNVEEREKLLSEATKIDELIERKYSEIEKLKALPDSYDNKNKRLTPENIVEEIEETDFEKLNYDIAQINSYLEKSKNENLNLTSEVISKNISSKSLNLENIILTEPVKELALNDVSYGKERKQSNTSTVKENKSNTEIKTNVNEDSKSEVARLSEKKEDTLNKKKEEKTTSEKVENEKSMELSGQAKASTNDFQNVDKTTQDNISASKELATNVEKTSESSKVNLNETKAKQVEDVNKQEQKTVNFSIDDTNFSLTVNKDKKQNENNNVEKTSESNKVEVPLTEKEDKLSEKRGIIKEQNKEELNEKTVNNNYFSYKANKEGINNEIADNSRKYELQDKSTNDVSTNISTSSKSSSKKEVELFGIPKTNEEKYKQNNEMIKIYKPKDIENTTNPKLLAAIQLEEDAEEYFNDAINSRQAAENESDPQKKKELLADAEEYMKIALVKQNEAVEIYKKHSETALTTKVSDNENKQQEFSPKENIPISKVSGNYAVDKSAQINEIIKELNDKKTEINNIRNTATTVKDAKERKKLYEKAQLMEEEVKKKEIETYTNIAKPNQEMFNQNKSELKKYVYSPINEELSLARLLAEESEIFFEKARQLRQKAEKEKIYSEQSAYLRQATEYELLAISKQQEAMAILSKYPQAQKGLYAENYELSPTGTNVIQTTELAKNTTLTTANSENKPITTAYPIISIEKNVGENVNKEVVEKKSKETAQKEEKSKKIPKEEEINKQKTLDNNLIAYSNQTVTTSYTSYKYPVSRQSVEQLTIAGILVMSFKNEATSTKDIVTTPIAKVENKKKETETYAENVTKKTEKMVVEEVKTVAPNLTATTPIEALEFSSPNFSTINFDPKANANKQAADLVIKNVVYEGLVYKVQISALKDPSTQYHFIGIDPISTELAENGFTRYMAGVFRDIKEASGAKRKLISLGFKGAFIVAYYNGKRITLDEANRLLASGNAVVSSQVPSVPSLSNYADPTDLVGANIPGVGEANVLSPVIAGAKDITQVTGTVYSVQVGVYSKPVTKGPLLTFENLYYNRLPNGLVKYYYGIYNTIAEATNAKSIAVNRGITDAFIVTFKNGERIATQFDNINVTQQQSNRPQYEDFSGKKQDVITPLETVVNPNENVKKTFQPVVLDEKYDITKTKGLIYTIQIGLYSQPVAFDRFENISNIHYHKLNSGHYRYMTGIYKTYEEAEVAKNSIIEIIPDAFITAYFNGERISINEAQKFK